ncbi:MAG: glycosyltransferase [Geminicoccaceae bacterium]
MHRPDVMPEVIPDVIIANGFDRFLLLLSAVEAERRGRLDQCLAGFYPTAQMTKRLSKLGLLKQKRIARLLDRQVALPDERLTTAPVLETLGYLGGRLVGHSAIQMARNAFARKAKSAVMASSAKIYHYRTGYGHGSAIAARQKGMVTLADHTIAHPAILAHLVDHQGRLPPKGEQGRIEPLWERIMDDLRHADRVLVNSDFVKETFVHQGWDPDRVEVVYQGLDDAFFDLLPGRKQLQPAVDAPLKLVFAGAFEQRKGADHLAEALSAIDDLPWTLELIGPIDEAMRTRHQAFLSDPRVAVVGRVDRRELAMRLSAADTFLFPSLAEGSARVVFEALAAGCYVVTTPNSGSIVKDGVHGALVKPDDPLTTVAALREANSDRSRVQNIGINNAKLICDNYRQSDFGEALMAVYDRLLADQRPSSRQKAA